MSDVSRRHFASTTASSHAIEAPWPEDGETACAASPMMIIVSRCQVGTEGMSYWLKPTKLSRVAWTIAAAGVLSCLKRSIKRCFHCALVVAASSSRLNACALGGLANHQISPEGLTV